VTIACSIILAAAMLQDAPKAPAAAGPLRPALEAVEQGTEDRGGLDATLRVQRIDLRLPTGFGDVYRVPGSSEKLMRGNGALFAIFGRSLYARPSGGALPITPAGTIYSIGMPGGWNFPGGELRTGAPSTEIQGAARRVDLRVKPTPADEPARNGEAADGGANDARAAVVDAMPAICEAPRASRMQSNAERANLSPVTDLRLGPARVVRGERTVAESPPAPAEATAGDAQD
jgi:hypothetical protein